IAPPSDKPCPVNMTNHVYFNLDGEQRDVRQHQLTITASRYLSRHRRINPAR
ncbi:hypothetical protein CJ307_35340, partial [Klebsiella quasipneumoniae]